MAVCMKHMIDMSVVGYCPDCVAGCPPDSATSPTPQLAITAACKRAGEIFAGLSFGFERAPAYRAWIVSATCKQCDKRTEIAAFDEDICDSGGIALVSLIFTLRCNTLGLRGKCIAEECVEPMDRKVDGMTVRECLERYQRFQRDDDRDGTVFKHPRGNYTYLTSAQKEAARLAWSVELKRKTAESKEREVHRVVVDDDRWEP